MLIIINLILLLINLITIKKFKVIFKYYFIFIYCFNILKIYNTIFNKVIRL